MAKKKKNDEMSIAELIKATPDGGVIEKPKRIPKRRRWIKWALVFFAVLWVIGTVSPPKDKATSTGFIETTNPDVAFVGNIPTNTPRASITPIIRETITAEALASMVAIQTQNAPTQTAIVEYVIITATLSEADVPTETSILSDVPLPTATPIVSNMGAVMVTNTPISSATPISTSTNVPTNTPLPISTATPSVRVLDRNGIVTYDFVNVRSCASSTCNLLGQLLRNATFDVTGTTDGENVSGSVLWYQMDYQGQAGYVHSSLVAVYTGQPPTNNVSVPAQSVSPVQPVVPISLAPAGGWNCNGEQYNCKDFRPQEGGMYSYAQMMDFWNTCPGDPSGLDGNPEDGMPCNRSR